MKYFLIFLIALISASYGQRQTVMVDTNGEVVFPTNFWQQAPVSTNVQEFIGTNAFNQTNELLEFLSRRHDTVYPQQESWSEMADAVGAVTPQGRIWIANSDPLTNSNTSIAVFTDPTTDLSQQTNLTITNVNSANGGFRYNSSRNVMYASGRNDKVVGINPTNYQISVISTNSGAQHRPAVIVNDYMYVSKGGAPSVESVAKIDLTTDTQITNISVSPTNANNGAIYRMETNPDETILSGAMTGLSGSNSVFWTIDLSDDTATITSTSNVIYNVFAANNTYAFVTGNPSGLFNLTNHAFTPIAGQTFSGVYDASNQIVYFFESSNSIVKYELTNSNTTRYGTGTNTLTGQAVVDGKVFATSGTNIYEINFVPFVSSQTLSSSDVEGVAELPLALNISITSNYALSNTSKDVYYNINPEGTNRNVLNTSPMEINSSIFRQGQMFTIRNNSSSNNINFLRFMGIPITTILPQQSKTWVLVNTSSSIFTNRWRQIYGREEMGLGGGITTNITFVDAATNTNTVSISNGIITGWTQ